MDIRELRIDNMVWIGGKLSKITDICYDNEGGTVYADISPSYEYHIQVVHPIKLTPEILTNHLGFTKTDLNGFTQFQLEDFILLRADIGMAFGMDMPFVFVISSSIKEPLNITEVHHLQNLFLDLKRKPLVWINS